jgi:two-component system, OmpR family, response regulator VicR
MTTERRYLTTGDVARECEVTLASVKKWIGQAKLHAVRTPGRHFRISVQEFERFKAEYRFPVEPEHAPRILVVDDSQLVVDFIVDALRDLVPGSELESASNGYEGLLKVGTFGPDLLILDLRMPGLDGMEVCRRIKANPAIRATRILMITAFAEKETAKEARRAGADGLLKKPLRLDALKAQVERMTRRPTGLRPGGRSPRRSS